MCLLYKIIIKVKKNGTVKDTSWDAAKKQLLGNVDAFVRNLGDFKAKVDEGVVPDLNWREVRKYLELEHFSYDGIFNRNRAAAGLCSWVINIVSYYDILVTVEPKRKALAEANERLQSANEQLTRVREKVAELQAALDAITLQYEKALQDKKSAIEAAERSKNKLDLAQVIIFLFFFF